MLLYTQRDETWPITKQELEGRGVCNALIQHLQAHLVPFLGILSTRLYLVEFIEMSSRLCFSWLEIHHRSVGIDQSVFALVLPVGGLYELL